MAPLAAARRRSMHARTTLPILLRLSRPDDLAFVASLSGDAFSQFGDYRDPISAWFQNPSVFTVVAEDGPALAGFAMLGFVRERPNETWVADLLAIAVKPGARRRGVGRRLIVEMVDVARRLGAPLGVAEMRLS